MPNTIQQGAAGQTIENQGKYRAKEGVEIWDGGEYIPVVSDPNKVERKLRPVTNRTSWNAGNVNNIMMAAKVGRTLCDDLTTAYLAFENYTKSGTGEDLPVGGIHIVTTLDLPNGNRVPVTFNGGDQVAYLTPGALAWSDPVTLNLPKESVIYESTDCSPVMPPDIRLTEQASTGVLSAGAYIYKVTCVTAAGESSPVQASITVSANSSVLIDITDRNFPGVKVLYYIIYRTVAGGAAATAFRYDNAPPLIRYIDQGNGISFATTTTTSHTNARTLTVATTAGLKPGDLIAIAVSGTPVSGSPFTVATVTSATSVDVYTNVTAASGANVTIATIPPATSLGFTTTTQLSSQAIYSLEGKRDSKALSRNAYLSYIATPLAGVKTAIGVFASPSDNLENKKTFGIIGASVEAGTGDNNSAKPYRGYVNRAIDDQFPYINVAVGGETGGVFAQPRYNRARMQLLSKCDEVFGGYIINDLPIDAVATIKSSLISIARQIITSGVKKYFQMTCLPRMGSSDGWRTYTNQSVSNQAYEDKRLELNTWLRSPTGFLADVGVAYSSRVSVIDIAAVVETNSSGVLTLNGGYWRVGDTSTLYSNTGTISGNTTSLTDSGQSWGVDALQGIMIKVTTGATVNYLEIRSNTATTITFDGTAGASVTSGTTYEVYAGSYTPDGIHLTNLGHETAKAPVLSVIN